MKKLLAAALSLVFVAATAVSFTACSSDPVVKIIPYDLSTESYGIGIQKGNTALKTQIDSILTELINDGVEIDGETVTFEDIYLEEMQALENGEFLDIGPVATESTNRAEELVVATNAEFAPFEYMANNSFGGIDMQVANILAKKMNKRLVVKHMAFDVVVDNVANKNADIAMAGLTISEDRKEKVDFSIEYCTAAQRLAVAIDDTTFDECKSKEDVDNILKTLSGVKAGGATAQTGLYYLQGSEDFKFEGFPNLEVLQYKKVSDAVQALAVGNIQIVCADKDVLELAVNGVNR